MQNDIELIRKLDFFEPLDEKIIKKIAQVCLVREFSSGDYIVRQGESGLGLYVITQGKAKVVIERGGAHHDVAELESGDFLGELSIIDEKARSANVICLEETRCLLLTRDSFTKLVSKYPEIALQMVRTLVGRIRLTNEKVTQPVALAAGTAAAALENPNPPTPEALPAASATSTNSSSFLDGIFSTVFNNEVFKTYSQAKAKAREALEGLFGALYLMKAFTRLSMAMVGCPVVVEPQREPSGVLQTSIQGVKVALFPAGKEQILRITGTDDGEYSATIFRPPARRGAHSTGVLVSHVEGSIRRNQSVRLHVPARRRIWIEDSSLQDSGALRRSGDAPPRQSSRCSEEVWLGKPGHERRSLPPGKSPAPAGRGGSRASRLNGRPMVPKVC